MAESAKVHGAALSAAAAIAAADSFLNFIFPPSCLVVAAHPIALREVHEQMSVNLSRRRSARYRVRAARVILLSSTAPIGDAEPPSLSRQKRRPHGKLLRLPDNKAKPRGTTVLN